MKFLLVLLALTVTLATTFGQTRYQPYPDKRGSCPPPLSVQICSRSCFSDFHCQGTGKCCPTICGGHVCSKPVTMKKESKEKPGSCPAVPTGRWICSSTCNTDGDCRGSRKCCKNRCGALTCQNPEVVENPEMPFVPLADSSNTARNIVARSPNFNRYYAYNN